MNISALAIAASMIFFHQFNATAAESLNPQQFIRQHGWEPYNAAHTARPPNPDIAPVLYYEDDDSVPSCGLISSVPETKKTAFIELMQAPKGEEFPQCVDVVSFVEFKLNSKDYLSVEYLVRDTREDLYRKFIYLYRDQKQGYTLNNSDLKPSTIKAKSIAAMAPTQSTVLDGVKLARIARLKQEFPQWQFRERDFISTKKSSFSVFEDNSAQQCYFATEAGDKPVLANETDFEAGSRCAGILATSRLEKSDMTYYIALLKLSTGSQIATLTSVDSNGVIRVEKELAETINRTGAIKDIKSIKMALSRAVH
jgi:hypothetical protein